LPFPVALLQVDGPNTLATWTYAFYTNLNFKVTDELRLTLGGRYSYEHKEFEGFQSDPNELTYKAGFGGPGGDANHDGIVDSLAGCPVPGGDAAFFYGFTPPGFFAPPAAGQTCLQYFGFPNAGQPDRFFPAGVDTQKFYLFTPKIGLEWSPTEDLMAYFSWSKGYKSGGWTTRLSFPNATPPRFGPEKARTFEGGIKSEWFDRRLRLNLAGFRTNYLGIQQNAFKFISPTIENAGDAHIHGAEMEMTALLTDNFVVNASLGWLKATYVRLAPAVGAELLAIPYGVDTTNIPVGATAYLPLTAGRSVTLNSKLRKTPEWKFTISPQYTIDMDAAGAIVLNLDYTWTSSLENDTENTFELHRPSVNTLNASVTYRAENGHWEAAVGGTNLTDDRYIVSGQANRAGGNISGAYNAPRQWFATVRVKY
jgi:iron complex outermembrane receptor protein